MSPFGKQPGCYREVGNACGLLWKRTRTFGFYKMRGIALRPENLPPTKKKAWLHSVSYGKCLDDSEHPM